MNLLKAVVLCLALLLAAEAAADVQVAKLSTSKGAFRSDNDADTSKSSEERALPFGLSSAFEKVHSFRASFRKWYRDYTTTASFEKWKLGDVPDLFKNRDFLWWVRTAQKKDPEDSHWWIRILMAKTNPYILSDTVTNAMRPPKNPYEKYFPDPFEEYQRIATELQRGRLEIWTEEGVPLAKVLGYLRLDKDQFLEHPAFKQWYEYCKRQSDYDSHAFIDAVLKRYTEDHVIKVLLDGLENSSTSGLAAELYEVLLTYYRTVEPTSADLIKRLFKFGPPINVDISSPKYRLWKDFARKGHNEPEHEALLEELKKVSHNYHILQYILMLKESRKSADLAHQMETLFVTELVKQNEMEYEKFMHLIDDPTFGDYPHVIKNKRKEYLESLRASTSENQ